MDHARIVAATMESRPMSAANEALLELSLLLGAAEPIRVEVGPSEGTDPLDEVQEIALWWGSSNGTGGTALTERVIRGGGTPNGAAVRNVTSLGTGNIVFRSSYHAQNGWLYLPTPEERISLVAGANDVFAVVFPVAPDAAMTLSATIVWGESQ